MNPVTNVNGDPKDNGPSCPSCGDPINPGSGNKFELALDYVNSTSSSDLRMARTYNGSTLNADANVVRTFGARWTQSYDSVLTQTPNAPVVNCYQRSDNNLKYCEYDSDTSVSSAVSIVRSDGKKYTFKYNGTFWANDANVNDRVTAIYDTDGVTLLGWNYLSAQNNVTERYDANGRLISITRLGGASQRLTYSNGVTNDTNIGRIPADAPVCTHVQAGAVMPVGRLLCVTDTWGHQLQFEYDAPGHIVKMIDPNQGATIYEYDGPSGGCSSPTHSNLSCWANNLTKVTYPDNSSKTYYYNEATQINGGTACLNLVAVGNGFGPLVNTLTGIVDENGVRYASWTYDCQGRATSSQHAGGVEKVALAYGVQSTNGTFTNTVTHYMGMPTNPQSVVSNYSYQMLLGQSKNSGIDQPCSECGLIKARSFDGNGNVSSATDWRGNLTTYTYDLNRNLETSRVEASGTPQARTISTQWHSTYRLPVAIAEPLRLTTFNYDTSGNLLSKTIQATTDSNGSQGFNAPVTGTPRTWTYTYNQFGQVLTATGPRTDVNDTTTYSYDAATGNLLTITNAAGQVTTLSNYDLNGRVGTIVDPNGITTNLSYAPRGWLQSKSVRSADGSTTQTTTYQYDGVGQLKVVTLPDNSTISYTYDDAHRLTNIADSLGNSIAYTLDAMGNRVSEQTKDPQGTLSRQITRIYDALNRLQQVTGAVQ